MILQTEKGDSTGNASGIDKVFYSNLDNEIDSHKIFVVVLSFPENALVLP
jgi:hypothetical protein